MPTYNEIGSGGVNTNGSPTISVLYIPSISGGTKASGINYQTFYDVIEIGGGIRCNGNARIIATYNLITSGGIKLSFQMNWGEAVQYIAWPRLSGAGIQVANFQGSWGFEWLYIAWPRHNQGVRISGISKIWAYYYPSPRIWPGFDDSFMWAPPRHVPPLGGLACRDNWPIGVLPIYVESTSVKAVVQNICPGKFKCKKDAKTDAIWCAKSVQMRPQNSMINNAAQAPTLWHGARKHGPSPRYTYAMVPAIIMCRLRKIQAE